MSTPRSVHRVPQHNDSRVERLAGRGREEPGRAGRTRGAATRHRPHHLPGAGGVRRKCPAGWDVPSGAPVHGPLPGG